LHWRHLIVRWRQCNRPQKNIFGLIVSSRLNERPAQVGQIFVILRLKRNGFLYRFNCLNTIILLMQDLLLPAIEPPSCDWLFASHHIVILVSARSSITSQREYRPEQVFPPDSRVHPMMTRVAAGELDTVPGMKKKRSRKKSTPIVAPVESYQTMRDAI